MADKASPEETGKERDYEVGYGKPPVEHQFQKGNPGRPKGSRNKLSEAFFKALEEDFAQNGVSVIATMRSESPKDYAKMIASLQSKELTGEDGAPIELLSRIERVIVEPKGSAKQ